MIQSFAKSPTSHTPIVGYLCNLRCGIRETLQQERWGIQIINPQNSGDSTYHKRTQLFSIGWLQKRIIGVIIT
jgi:hypothetical protein